MQTIKQRYTKTRQEHPTLAASQAIIWARSAETQDQTLSPYGLDWRDDGEDQIAMIDLPKDDEPNTIKEWAHARARDPDRADIAYVARVRMVLDNDGCSDMLDSIGEFSHTPEYGPSYRLRSFDRNYQGTRDRNTYRYFTPDCDPWDERHAWGGCKHERYRLACECARGQWKYAERVAEGDVFAVGYVIEVFVVDDIEWDKTGEEWDITGAEPIGEGSCWGFDGSAKDKESDVWDILGEAWDQAQTEAQEADTQANQNIATL